MKGYLCKCSRGYMLLIPQSLHPRSYIYQKSTPARRFRQGKLLRMVLLWNSSEMTRYFPFFPAGWHVNSSETVDLNRITCDQWQMDITALLLLSKLTVRFWVFGESWSHTPIHSFIQFYGLSLGCEIINTTNHWHISPVNTLRTNTNLNYT